MWATEGCGLLRGLVGLKAQTIKIEEVSIPLTGEGDTGWGGGREGLEEEGDPERRRGPGG